MTIFAGIANADFTGLSSQYCANSDPAILTPIPAGGNFTITGNKGLIDNTFYPSQVTAGINLVIIYLYK